MKTIKVQIKNIYGNDLVYPACPAAVLFAQIAGSKTLTHGTLCLIERLGYEITIEQPSYSRVRAA